MFKNSYKRFLFSKGTFIILVILTAISVVSFFLSWENKQLLVVQIGDPSPDLNQELLMRAIDSSTGIRFLFDYWFNTGLFSLALMMMYAWMGAFLSSHLQIEKDNGFGNLIINRLSYKKYLNQLLLSQSLYILTIFTLSTIISLVLALFIGGLPINGAVFYMGGGYNLSPIQVAIVFLIQVIWMSIILIFVNSISLLSNLVIKNRYMLQALPILLFGFSPYLLGTAVGNLIPAIGHIIVYFFPDSLTLTISMAFNANFDMRLTFISILPALIFLVIFVMLYKLNLKSYSEDYL